MAGLVAEPRAAHVGEIVAASFVAVEEEPSMGLPQTILPGDIPIGKSILHLEGRFHALKGMERPCHHLDVGKAFAKEAGAAQGARSATLGALADVVGDEDALGLFHHDVGVAAHGRYVETPAMTSGTILVAKRIVLVATDVPVAVVGIEVIRGIFRAEERLGLGDDNSALVADGSGAGAVIHGSDIDAAAIAGTIGGRMGHGKTAIRKDDHLLALLDDVVNGARRGGDGQNQRGQHGEDDLGQKILRLLGLFLRPLLVDGVAESEKNFVVKGIVWAVGVQNTKIGGLAVDFEDGLVSHAMCATYRRSAFTALHTSRRLQLLRWSVACHHRWDLLALARSNVKREVGERGFETEEIGSIS